MAKTRDASLYAAMDDWRDEVFDRDFGWSGMTPEMVLPTTLIDKIARIQQPLKRAVIERLLKLDWIYYDQYGREMLDRFPRSAFPLASDCQPNSPPTVSADVPPASLSSNLLGDSMACKVPPASVHRSNGKRSATDAGVVDVQPSSRRGKRPRRDIPGQHTATGRVSPSLSAPTRQQVDAREGVPTSTPPATTLPRLPPAPRRSPNTTDLPLRSYTRPQQFEDDTLPPNLPSTMSSQQHRRYEPPLLNSQQHGKSYAHRALERPSLDHHSLHHQPSRPSSGSLATPSASHQGYPLVELSHPYTPAQGRPYTTTPYTALAERSITARAYQRSQPAFPSPQDRIPRAWDNSRLTAPITSTSIPRMPVSSAIATPTAQSTPGVYRPFTPQLNIALDPRQMRLVAPCANLDRDVICSVGRVLAPGSVHVTADGRWTIAQLAQVVCRCAVTREAYHVDYR